LFSLNVILTGHYTVELIDAKTQCVKKTLRFQNIITNNGLDFPTNGAPTTQLLYLAVGTGSTSPLATNSQLEAELSPVGRTNLTGGFVDVVGYNASPEYHYVRRTRTFFESQANGNLTEVGFFTAASGGQLFNRQLFRDSGGTPTTITKTNQEQLRVTYELRLQPPQADVVGTVVISGVTYDYTLRPVAVPQLWGNLFNQGWGTTQLPRMRVAESDVLLARNDSTPGAPTTVESTSGSSGSYAAGQHYRDSTQVWEPGSANFATGIGSIFMLGPTNDHSMCFQAVVSPKIPKTNLHRLSLTVRTTWGRV
jgi:hypothetical protein